ncbi:MAG: leucine-rich repeat protein [Clostridia bacterium]|nr:leucine-rich repeat protein [Clostridia bacterium]
MKKKILFFSIIIVSMMCLLAVSASAATTQTIDGITYYLNNSEASVTSANQSCDLEKVVIPEKVTHDGVDYTVKYIDKEAFKNNTTVKYLSLPATVTNVGFSAFNGCSNLVFVDFNDNSNNIVFDNWGQFMNCTSLQAISIPDNVTAIPNRFVSGCTNLKAVYLPANLESVGTNGYNENSAFSYCTNMYFVDTAFEVVDGNGDFYTAETFTQPEKKSVYFMPENLTSFFERAAGGVGFNKCTSLNSTIVFGSKLTALTIGDGTFYECGTQDNPLTIVFLGDMTQLNFSTRDSRALYTSYVFANKNDKSLADVNVISNYAACNMKNSAFLYFCAGECSYAVTSYNGTYTDEILTKTTTKTNFTNPIATKTTQANCENPEMQSLYCFCGKFIADVYVEGSVALGHDYISDCDTTCNRDDCSYVRETSTDHSWSGDCDSVCNVCSDTREVSAAHTSDYACKDEDGKCNVCGADVTLADHSWSGDCDSICNVCSDTREVSAAHTSDYACKDEDGKCNVCGADVTLADHTYDNVCADADCNVCTTVRTEFSDHEYAGECDSICENCNGEREVSAAHTSDYACKDEDGKCNVCGADVTLSEHVYDNACDADCNVCSATRTPADHVYDNACDADCNVCSATRTPADHVYDNACDADCNVCSAVRTPASHVYDNECADTECNICNATRTELSSHTFGEWTETKAPTRKENGEKERVCSDCGAKETAPVDALGGLGGGAIAAIVIGSVAVVALGAYCVYTFIIKKKRF